MARRLANRATRRGDGIVRSAAGGPAQRGFTLVEVVLVMALVAITGVLALGVLTGGFDRMLLRSSAKEMTAQLRFARAHAIATGTPQRFEIDPRARTWRSAGKIGRASWRERVLDDV
ncbi:MAG: prepilin-type N-terminal cleavage/methylation domain-containing protein, partial [Luteimonas sp.]|nr:prepilin-type N-terminal cleavage/methylation domain-containing protein [Luteimonas sp.]